jgi:hypothetical protein
MKTSKILEILGVKERQGGQMTIYYITVKLENGETITLGKRKKDALVVGQSITYTEEETADGKKKYKEVRPSFSKGAGISNKQIAAIGGAIISAS